MFVVISAVSFDQIRFIVVCSFIKITIRLYETGPVKRLARVVTDDKLDIGFVKVPQLGRERMTYVLVRDYHFGRDAIAAGDLKAVAIDRSDKFFGGRPRSFSSEREDIDAQSIVFEKLVDGTQLVRPFVEGWNRRVSSGPAMRDQRAFLGGNVEQRRRFALHVTGITSLFVAHVKRMRRLF